MKKYISKFLTLAFAAFGTFSFLLFSSCDGVIFHTIRDEVELADAKLSGDIQNIVRYKDEIFVSTGEIWHRDTSDTKKDWASFTNPSSKYVYSLAADSANLYALTVSLEEDDDGYNVAKTRTLYCYDGSSWTQIWSQSYSKSVYAILFCTNSPKEANREAYFRYGSTVWKLDGTTSLTADNTFPTDSTDNSTTPTTGVRSCTVLGDEVYFSSAYAMASNETKDESSTCIYRCDSSTIYYSKDGSSWSSANLGCDTIYSIGITKDYILVGTKSGIAHQKWSSTFTPTGGAPATGTSDFDTNAASTLSSYYEVPTILVVDPAQAEKAATIYASSITSSSSASLNNVGLWSYFASKGEWNRE